MAYCRACGSEIANDAAFCAKCGAAQGATAPGPTVVHVAAAKPTTTVSLIRILVLFLLLAIAIPTCAICGGTAYVCGKTATSLKADASVPEDDTDDDVPARPVYTPPIDSGPRPTCLDPDRFAESESARTGIPMCKRRRGK